LLDGGTGTCETWLLVLSQDCEVGFHELGDLVPMRSRVRIGATSQFTLRSLACESCCLIDDVRCERTIETVPLFASSLFLQPLNHIFCGSRFLFCLHLPSHVCMQACARNPNVKLTRLAVVTLWASSYKVRWPASVEQAIPACSNF
jgi:hypothetical protein